MAPGRHPRLFPTAFLVLAGESGSGGFGSLLLLALHRACGRHQGRRLRDFNPQGSAPLATVKPPRLMALASHPGRSAHRGVGPVCRTGWLCDDPGLTQSGGAWIWLLLQPSRTGVHLSVTRSGSVTKAVADDQHPISFLRNSRLGRLAVSGPSPLGHLPITRHRLITGVLAEHSSARFCAWCARAFRLLSCPGLPSPGRIASQRLRGLLVLRRVKERCISTALACGLGGS
jgi:hypothetical protein